MLSSKYPIPQVAHFGLKALTSSDSIDTYHTSQDRGLILKSVVRYSLDDICRAFRPIKIRCERESLHRNIS